MLWERKYCTVKHLLVETSILERSSSHNHITDLKVLLILHLLLVNVAVASFCTANKLDSLTKDTIQILKPSGLSDIELKIHLPHRFKSS